MLRKIKLQGRNNHLQLIEGHVIGVDGTLL